MVDGRTLELREPTLAIWRDLDADGGVPRRIGELAVCFYHALLYIAPHRRALEARPRIIGDRL